VERALLPAKKAGAKPAFCFDIRIRGSWWLRGRSQIRIRARGSHLSATLCGTPEGVP
jgi:hypothetical protein